MQNQPASSIICKVIYNVDKNSSNTEGATIVSLTLLPHKYNTVNTVHVCTMRYTHLNMISKTYLIEKEEVTL